MIKRYFIIFICLPIVISPIYAVQINISYIFDNLRYNRQIASSFLIEKEKQKDYYHPKKAFDNNKDTAWVEGVNGDGINEYICFNLPISPIPEYQEYSDKPIKMSIEIINGFAKSENLFKANHRVKKALLEIYEAEIRVGQDRIQRIQQPILNSIVKIYLKDSVNPQKFIFKIKPKQKPNSGKFSMFRCIGKLIIKEVYRGKKYRDTCISEIKVKQIKD